ncbi:DNA cytosine methyltransferase [Streptomyces sp. NPDC091292]|uniref:DNA cytosine methyltransferase n=1 Tax=Streptomyces sp. NPDC091292 TaxID=3365991 RepID=UPI003811961B
MRAAKIIDLFAGPGGLDVAAQKLGIPVTGIEWDPDACHTRREAERLSPKGAAELRTIEGDVREYGPKDFPEATVLAGGPPCQTYTVAGGGEGRRALNDVLRFAERMADGEDVTEQLAALDDVRTGLVLEPLRWALAAHDAGQPYDAIVLEQVPAVLPVWKAVGRLLRGLDYEVDHGVLRTEQFGVPQTRRRAILIARRNREVELPRPIHRHYRKGVSQDQGDKALEPWVSMGEVLDRPTPYDVISNYGTGGDPKDRGRRRSTEPAATVTGKISRNRVLMPLGQEDRFTFAEAGRLQTFPADYPWSGRAVPQQIGNAVPPLLAVHVLATALDLGDDVVARAIASLMGPGARTRNGVAAVPGRRAPLQLALERGRISDVREAARL